MTDTPSTNLSRDNAYWDQFWRDLGWTDDQAFADTEHQLMRQRAEQYARQSADADDTGTRLTLLVFKLGREYYGVDAPLVRTVREVHSITPVPAVPQFYRGVVNIRGQIITVMDLRIFFGMSVESQDIPRELAVVNTGDLEIGLLAHQVQEVRVVQLTEIAPVEDIRYARGITRDGLIVLDIARLFQEKRLIAGASED